MKLFIQSRASKLRFLISIFPGVTVTKVSIMKFVHDVQHFSLDLSQVMYCFPNQMSGFSGYPLFFYHGKASPKNLWSNNIRYERAIADAFRNIIMCIYNDISKYAFVPLKQGQRLAYGVSPYALGLRSEGQPDLPFLRKGEPASSFTLDSIQSVFEELLKVSGSTEWEFLKNTIRELARPDSEAHLKKYGELGVNFWWGNYSAEYAWFGYGPTHQINRNEWIEVINRSAADLIDRNYGTLCSVTGEPLEKPNLAILANLISPAHQEYQALPGFGGAVCAENSTEQYWLPPLFNYKKCNQIDSQSDAPSSAWIWLCLLSIVLLTGLVYKRRYKVNRHGYHKVAAETQILS